ncbi:SDR family NAD(P)-dependent oxidoreductase [Paenibacillus sp. UMB4589-SE434]|uniref:SDR family NAD(P)-dependent oxidoreductase n=1 Tax=Paenibacillus sp. UMB4589-SE434 TaxID=3046314 RepID=UPI00254F284A|nr:SDR family NAD(P)-dependent oxidoreductase [Paenibacillus sp. UMB4589-SE434]MDK8179893.1 SDR family NAD(P)-dependent oxidoreductase [Paenibacillus sp. UMB4589-SE434]
MGRFNNKNAIITGAASGIGRALASRCAADNMKIVLADIEEEALYKADKELTETGATVLSVVTDVGNEGHIHTLAEKTLSSFGGVQLLFNNAGVGGGSNIWSSSIADWQWVLNVNLWGSIYTTRVFVPIMLELQEDCHIVNTASRAGLETGPGNSIYRVSKHALVSLTETLYHELKLTQSRIGVSLLCPGFVNTRICDAGRNRPSEYSKPGDITPPSLQESMIIEFIRAGVEQGVSPDQVAAFTFNAIEHNKFYILPDSESKDAIQQRMEHILNEHNPTFIIPETQE